MILHFHGWGFRKGDPFAGYLVGPAGTVRDVAQEHWEQQISSLKGAGPQVVAILAQGRGKSDFSDFPTFEYVRDVLKKSGRPELVKLAESENYTVVLSAHSGGGRMKVVPSLGRGEADAAERSALKSQLPSKADGRVINKLQPVDLVVFYEALNGDGDVDAVMNSVDRRLTRIVPQLQQSPDKALAATPTLRGYYGSRKSGYRERYRWLACRIQDAIASRVPEKFRPDVADRFRIIEVAGPKGEDVEHEQVISGTGPTTSGSLADALRAARNPQGDRTQAVTPDEEECKKLKERAKQRAKEREEAAKRKEAAKAAQAGRLKHPCRSRRLPAPRVAQATSPWGRARGRSRDTRSACRPRSGGRDLRRIMTASGSVTSVGVRRIVTKWYAVPLTLRIDWSSARRSAASLHRA